MPSGRNFYSELAEALGCDCMDSHEGRLKRARRLAALPESAPPVAPASTPDASLPPLDPDYETVARVHQPPRIQVEAADAIEHLQRERDAAIEAMLLARTEQASAWKRAETAERERDALREACEPGKASGIVRAMFDEAQKRGLSPVSSKHALTYLLERLETAERERDEARQLLRDAALFLVALPQDLGRGSLNGARVQLDYKISAVLGDTTEDA